MGRNAPKQPRRHGLRIWLFTGALIFAAASSVGALFVDHPAPETWVDESKLPELPAPSDLPPVTLPRFRVLHPRLPSPSPSDLATLTTWRRRMPPS